MSRRASAIAAPGIVLSHPTSTTRASKRLPRDTSSIESAITSRLTSEVRMPAEPIVIPSEIDTVLNSIGVPPAARIPALTDTASSRRWKLHGPISIHVLSTPTTGRFRSARVNPAAWSIARAGARLGPSVMPPLCHLSGLAWSSATPRSFLHRRALGDLSRCPPSGVRAERPERRGELCKVNHRARALEILAGGGHIEIEEVLPWPARHRAGFQLGQIDVAQREYAQGLEERAGRTLEREDDARLVRRAQ